MISLMLLISTYIFVAILLGYFFGWLITKLLLKERYQAYLDEVHLNNNVEVEEINRMKNELSQYKKDNKLLKVQNKDFTISDAAHNKMIEELTIKLSLVEKRQVETEKEYESEVDAFMFERVDITQKYKELLVKFNLLQKEV